MLLAILLPPLSFLLRGKIGKAMVCLFLQAVLIGWIPAAIWAVMSLQNERADRRNETLIRAIQSKKS